MYYMGDTTMTGRLEIRYKNSTTKENFKTIAAKFPNYEDALIELMKIYNAAGRSVPVQKTRGDVL